MDMEGIVPKIVTSYICVSTARQGSGLGLEAQREAIARFCKSEGYSLDCEFIEIERGGPSSPPRSRPPRRSRDRWSSPSSIGYRAM